MGNWTRHRRRGWRAVLVAGLLAGGLAAGSVAPAAGSTAGGAGAAGAGAAGTGAAGAGSATEGRRSYTGTIDGAEYRVEVPAHWNGTLVLYSHGYFPPTWPFEGVALTNAPQTEQWLLDHGVALAASNYQGKYGFQVARAQQDQIALLDWFEANVGRPDRTISMGQSQGGPIALRLAERHPERFDGVMTVCAAADTQGLYDAALDIAFATRTLLADPGQEIDLVHARDPEASTAALMQAVDQALTTPEGQARLALIASLGNVTGWWSAHEPPPATDEERILNQANWIRGAVIGGYAGPSARVDLEAKVGGNPSSNVGVDYHRQVARSSQTELVEQAYRDAGLDLEADLDRLDAAPRIAADPQAVDFMYRTSVPRGRTPVPVATLHTTGDGGAVPDHERWYAQQVERHGDPDMLRQAFVERGAHCSFSTAEEVAVLGSLLERIETGRWPSTSPRRLNAEAATFGEPYRLVLDLVTGEEQVMDPAFVRYTPPRPMRPSR